nr:fibrillin 2 [Hymenolepis microstoma]
MYKKQFEYDHGINRADAVVKFVNLEAKKQLVMLRCFFTGLQIKPARKQEDSKMYADYLDYMSTEIVAHGLGLIFDVSMSETSSIVSSQYELSDYGGNRINRFQRKPCRVDVLEVYDLNSLASMETILGAESRRIDSHWLIVSLRDSTTTLLFPPRKTRYLSHSGFTACLEWLEEDGVNQVLIAIPQGDSKLFKTFLFLGFSKLPEAVLENQLPIWCSRYVILVTDMSKL